MKTLVEQLTQYASYHRDFRNILSHFIGIPLIVVAVTTLLSRPALALGGVTASPATVAALLAVVYYLRLDLRFGVVMAAMFGLSLWAGQSLATQATAVWLGAGLGLFVLGWIIQFVGHYYEGRKPAFVDDLIGLVIGPLFVVAEFGFLLGLRDDVRQAVEQGAGPVRHTSRQAA